MIRELFIFYEWLHFSTSVRDYRYIYMICFHLINNTFSLNDRFITHHQLNTSILDTANDMQCHVKK